ncbi:MAG: NifU family protein [Polyangia bacterium]|jgi:Fe-S cluster biogenesis protein NfuA
MSEARPVPLIAIRAEVLLSDPNMCKFTVSQSVHPGGPFFFDRPEHAAGSPLPEQLFGLAGVAHVLISENVVSVGKLAEVEWSQLKAAIGARIRAQLLTGAPSILENTSPKVHWGRPDTEVRAAIQELLDGEVNRGIAGHGGRISLVDYQDGKLRIAMSGGCQGCASSQVTLRQGVEIMVRNVAPEVVEIVDATDHAAGKTPYYAPP